uniref:Putative secreted protein n=1 Tax=Ixodes ricinus TaxID=34613 RepID=A0A6B0UKM5_IXORI
MLFTGQDLAILKFISRVRALAVFATSALNLPLCPFYNFKLGDLIAGSFSTIQPFCTLQLCTAILQCVVSRVFASHRSQVRAPPEPWRYLAPPSPVVCCVVTIDGLFIEGNEIP